METLLWSRVSTGSEISLSGAQGHSGPSQQSRSHSMGLSVGEIAQGLWLRERAELRLARLCMGGAGLEDRVQQAGQQRED